MDDHRHYIAIANIERFQTLLQGGQLDRGQICVVRALLAQTRAELATLERGRCSELAPCVKPRMPVALAGNDSARNSVLPPPAGASAPPSAVEVYC
jgi:hypothetical protein